MVPRFGTLQWRSIIGDFCQDVCRCGSQMRRPVTQGTMSFIYLCTYYWRTNNKIGSIQNLIQKDFNIFRIFLSFISCNFCKVFFLGFICFYIYFRYSFLLSSTYKKIQGFNTVSFESSSPLLLGPYLTVRFRSFCLVSFVTRIVSRPIRLFQTYN